MSEAAPETTPESTPKTTPESTPETAPDAARRRLAHAQHALLSALVADAPPPPGFDPQRLRAQQQALLGKRADVVAKVAPELPEILGADFRRLFLAHARGRPMSDGYRQDALDFAEALLKAGDVRTDDVRTDGIRTDGSRSNDIRAEGIRPDSILTDPGQRERLAAWTAARHGAPSATPAPLPARLASAWHILRSRVTRKATAL